ncbi:MAG: LuxR C-terminal-related transcriptional regulator [Lachnospiraceae bacterium]|nr:LuxR C-terminal-related transcriptional regulator [Lachnospiraceae bacterium]
MIDEIIENIDKIINDLSGITANRLSIINGKYDFTEYGPIFEENAKLILDKYASMGDKNNAVIAKCIVQIILAEIYYQKNDCYDSLIMVNSALAFLEEEGNEEIWIVGRFFQMCIMIVTGQVSAIYPLVDGMETRIYKNGNKELIGNYEALRAWCALYDNARDIIDSWMINNAPNEYGEMRLSDSFAYMVKARIYYMQERYLACGTLLKYLIKLLENNNRYMELCEAYMLMALALYADKHTKEAFEYFEKSLVIAMNRKFVRLLADEGEAMYMLARSYKRKAAIKDEFLNTIIKASKEMALMYPQYLKKYKDGFTKFTEKEIEILRLLADKRNNKEIAEFLDNTPNTIKHHLKNIYGKLGVNSRTEAVEVATKEHII